MSWSLSPTSLSIPPHAPTPYLLTRSPSLGPSMTLRPMPSGMGPFHPIQSRTSLQDMRTLPPSSCEPSLQALPPPYKRGRRSTIVRLTTSGNTLQISMQSVAPSSNTSETLLANPYYALMDLRTTMGGSPPSLPPAQIGRALLSSSNNWMTAEWWDLAPEQEASMMLALLTSLPYHPLMTNPSNPSLTGSMPISRATTPTFICFRRPSLPSMTGVSSPRSNETGSWTKRLPCYRQSLTWWT